MLRSTVFALAAAVLFNLPATAQTSDVVEATADCAAHTHALTDVLVQHRGVRSLTVNLKGNCPVSTGGAAVLVITNPNLELRPVPGGVATIHGLVQNPGAILKISDLRITDGGIGFGVETFHGGTTVLDRVVIDQAYIGATAFHGATVRIKNSVIRSGRVGIVSHGTSTMTVQNSTIVSRSQATRSLLADGTSDAAIVSYGQGNVIVSDSKIVRAPITEPSIERLAVHAHNTSHITINGGEVAGTMRTSAHSIGAFSTVIRGRVQADDGAYVSLAGSEATLNGSVIVENDAIVAIKPGMGAIGGSIVCRTGGRVFGALSGLTLVHCPIG